MSEKISGYIDKIIYKNELNGYVVFEVVTAEEEEIICVGNCEQINEGEKVEVEGDYVDHKTYGVQLKLTKIEVVMPDNVEAIEKYLASGAIRGIGQVMAKRVVDKFGEDTFRIMQEEPERLAEIKGISMNIARKISEQYDRKRDMKDAVMYLQKYGITNQMAVKIYNEYKEKMYDVISNNPYKLAEDIRGIGFRMADEIGSRVGIDFNSDFRKKCAINHILSQAGAFGHIYLPERELLEQTRELLKIHEDFSELLIEMVINRDLVKKEEEGEVRYYTNSMYYMELNCSRILHDLNCEFAMSEKRLLSTINGIEQSRDIKLADMQKHAIKEALNHGVLIVTGGPGTGKTTTIDSILHALEMEGLDFLLAAPTGRAAKRMTEATGHQAQTIHRLLELSGNPSDDGAGMSFQRNEEYPLETDAIIIDEMSMVDLPLLQALLKAIVVGTRIILVGDVNQLPSVGPGNVLQDIIESEAFTVVQLNEVFRQSQDSDIIMNAHRINAGEQIELDNKSNDFFMLQRYDAKVIINIILQLIMRNLPSYVGASMMDIQVLSPMRKGELGVDNLNVQLQMYMNPQSNEKSQIMYRDTVYREGDKVMQIKNNYQITWERRGYHGVVIEEGTGVFNGDMGIIRRIDTSVNEVTVEYDDNRYVLYPYTNLDEIELAYAITVHKSQGSEYPAVVIPLLTGSSLLFHRNLLYTAVTRAKKCVTIVGTKETVLDMIQNVRDQKRHTTLKLRIRELKN